MTSKLTSQCLSKVHPSNVQHQLLELCACSYRLLDSLFMWRRGRPTVPPHELSTNAYIENGIMIQEASIRTIYIEVLYGRRRPLRNFSRLVVRYLRWLRSALTNRFTIVRSGRIMGVWPIWYSNFLRNTNFITNLATTAQLRSLVEDLVDSDNDGPDSLEVTS